MIIYKVFGKNTGIDIASLKENDINITGIAHSLGMQVRWNGHCKDFFSIAEHSILGALYLMKTKEYSNTIVPMQFLLHDAYEAYTGDLIQPFKEHIRVDIGEDKIINVREMDDKGTELILKNFGVGNKLDPIVKEVDNCMTCIEELYLFDTNPIIEPKNPPLFTKMMNNIDVKCYNPKKAGQMFISAYNLIKNNCPI